MKSTAILLSLLLVIVSTISSEAGVAKADSIIATVKVGIDPVGIAFDSANNNMYVTNQGQPSGPGSSLGTVSVINSSTNEVIGDPIPVGSYPIAVAFDSANNNVYVTNSASSSPDGNSVSVIDGSTNTVIDTIPVGMGPVGIAFDSDNGNLYVTNINSNTVSVIDGSTNTVIDTIPVGSRPYGVVFDSNNENIYVANYGDNSVSVIDGSTNTVIGNPIPVGNAPVAIAFDSDNNNIYVTDDQSDSVSVIDGSTNTVIDTISVGDAPDGIAFNSANKKMYVTTGQGSIYVIDGSTNKVTDIIPVSQGLVRIAFNPTNNNMYAVNINLQTVYVISTAPQPPVDTNPPNTTITSVVDGNNIALTKNGDSTASTEITFTFVGEDNVAVRGFECRLDSNNDGDFKPCTTPATYKNLNRGDHTFEVRALDTSGNRDPSPARFSWKILTPAEGIQEIIDTITGMNIPNSIQKDFIHPLQQALKILKDNNPNNDKIACSNLDLFLQKVNANLVEADKKITKQQAEVLVHQTNIIKNILSCPSLPPPDSENLENQEMKVEEEEKDKIPSTVTMDQPSILHNRGLLPFPA